MKPKITLHQNNMLQSGLVWNKTSHQLQIYLPKGLDPVFICFHVVFQTGGFTLSKTVNVYYCHQVVQFIVAGKRKCLPNRALCTFAISNKTIHTVTETNITLSLYKVSISLNIDIQFFMMVTSSYSALSKYLPVYAIPAAQLKPCPREPVATSTKLRRCN